MCKWRIKFQILITLDVMYSSKRTVSLRTRAKPWPEERCSSVLVDVINGVGWGGVGAWHNWISVKVQFRSWNIHQQYWKECTSVGWFILSRKMVIQLPASLRRLRGKYHFGTKRTLFIDYALSSRTSKKVAYTEARYEFTSASSMWNTFPIHPILSWANGELFMFFLWEPRYRKVLN